MVAGFRARSFIATLAIAVALACSGVVAVVFQPARASAGVTPGIAPDFTLAAGDTATETYGQLLVGSAEVKGQPDQCRDDTPYNLTCAAHRLKLRRSPGAALRIVLEWDTPTGDVFSVPDVDMFLFDSPTSSFDATVVGGAGQTVPEQIDIAPTQDEYDVVVQAYAGALSSYKLTVFYGVPVASKGANETAITPDIVLTPHGKTFVKEYQSTVISNPALAFFPEGCRSDPTSEPFCDVFRIKLNRSKAKGAINYVVVSLEWTAIDTPALQTPALGLVGQKVPNLDMYVYDQPTHSLDGVGGTTLTMPERVGFVATQDEYDLVVQAFDGATTGYKITAFMTDELFDKPFELLDPLTGNPIAPAFDPATGTFDPTKIDAPTAILPLAPIDVDGQIAGIGLGTTEQFDRDEAIRLGQEALRNVALTSDPPSGFVLVLALVVVPIALLAGGIVVMRRRHNTAF